jgi:hypothetical protein
MRPLVKNMISSAIGALLSERRKRVTVASVALISVGSILTAALVLASTSHHRPLPESSAPVRRLQPAAQSPAQPLATDKRGLHGLVFTLYPSGIEPAVLHTTKGIVVVSIEDHSGGSAGLVIERETGSLRVVSGQVHRFENHWRGKTELRLEPGRYHVFDSSRPDNEAEIVVDQ